MKIFKSFESISGTIGILTSIVIFFLTAPYTNIWQYLIPLVPAFLVFLFLLIKKIISDFIASKLRYFKNEYNIITSTRIDSTWILQVENESGDLTVTKHYKILCVKSSNISRTKGETVYSECKQENLPPQVNIRNSNNPQRKLVTNELFESTETIAGKKNKRYRWTYSIIPPLQKPGDYIEYCYETEMKKECTKAFSPSGDILILEQRKIQQNNNLTMIAPRGYYFVIIEYYIEDFDGTKINIKKEEHIPKLRNNQHTLEWNTEYIHFARYICFYKFEKYVSN